MLPSTKSITSYPLEFVELNGEDVYYRDSGEGEPLVLLHGGSGNHLVWWQQANGLAPEYRCIIPDQPEHGLSRDRSDGPARIFEPEEFVALLDHLDIEAATFVGHSMGGWAAAKFAEQHPERTRALVLADSPAGLIEEWWTYVPEETRMSHMYADSLDPNMEFLFDYLWRVGIGTDSDVDFDVSVDPAAINEAGTPVAIIYGEADDFYPPSMFREIEDMLTESECFVVDGAGHSPYFEKPDEFNRILSEFLTQL